MLYFFAGRARVMWLALAGILVFAGPVFAHPHIWVENAATVVFDAGGRVSQIRHIWTFDAAFSAWTTQGLDVNNDGIISPAEMQELADQNVDGLAAFAFYTFAGEGETNLDFLPDSVPRMHMDNGRVVLEFSLGVTEPYAIRSALEIEVTDPDYYVSFEFPALDSTRLENAPAGCRVESHAPKPLDDATAKKLAAIGPEQVELPPDLKLAVRDQTNIAIVRCPPDVAAASPATALEAAQSLGRVNSAPFGGPPPEGSLPMPRGGFLGWVNAEQKVFYRTLTGALGSLKSDGGAVIVLGVMSFLYGIFHAAGPGHGKVVISSYVLAGERNLRRGIVLSFLAALMQSMSAIVFVLVAVAVLNLTSMAMSGAAASIEIWSYALILGLGVWLLTRKLFGFGGHAHDGDDHKHRPAGSVDGHVRVVAPRPGGNWREELGLVVAVGLRPCSGALIVLVFALSQGVVLAGVGAVLLMGLGTALTVSTLASLAVGAKTLALTIGQKTGGDGAARLVRSLEVLGALMLIVFGAVMLAANLM